MILRSLAIGLCIVLVFGGNLTGQDYRWQQKVKYVMEIDVELHPIFIR